MGYTNPTYLIFQCGSSLYDYVDSSTLFFGGNGQAAPFATRRALFRSPVKGTIIAAYGYAKVGTVGTAEDSVISVDLNTSPTTISSVVEFTADPTLFENAALNIPVAIGDLICCKIICPAWATNPLQVQITVNLLLRY